MKYNYGYKYKQYDVKEKEIWIEKKTNSLIFLNNIFDEFNDVYLNCDMLFIDPPWNLGNLNCFYTKADRNDYLYSFDKFLCRLKEYIFKICPKILYIEIGKQYINDIVEMFRNEFNCVQIWDTVYYKKNKCYVIRFSNKNILFDFTGWDESDVIAKSIQIETFNCIGDFFMGQGLVGINAFKNKKRFIGSDINKKRLAVLIDKVVKNGGEFTIFKK